MNVLAPVPEPLPTELVEVLAQGHGAFRLERIVSRQHASPPGFWYEQETAEWVLLLQGSAVLSLLDAVGQIQTVHLRPGDFIELPAHARHRVESTDPEQDTVWIALHGAT